MNTIEITDLELRQIGNLSEGKLIHLLSVIDDKGWDIARILLPAMSYSAQ